MPFDDDDWSLLSLVGDGPRAAIVGFLNRLQQWIDWVESTWPGAVGRELDTEQPFREVLAALQRSMATYCLLDRGAIDGFMFRMDHVVGERLSSAWWSLSEELVYCDQHGRTERLVECMEVFELWVNGSTDIFFYEHSAPKGPNMDRLANRGKGLGQPDPEYLVHVALPGSSLSLARLLRWWPHIRAMLQTRDLVPTGAIVSFCQAVEDYATELKDEGFTARRGSSGVTAFANLRSPRNKSSKRSIDSIAHITTPLHSIRSTLGDLNNAFGVDEVTLDALFDVLLDVNAFARPGKRGAVANKRRANRVRLLMRELAPELWHKGITFAAWARFIADDPRMLRISAPKGPKRSAPISWKTLQGYLAKDFSPDGQKRCVEASEL
jgi:hypothetical protein